MYLVLYFPDFTPILDIKQCIFVLKKFTNFSNKNLFLEITIVIKLSAGTHNYLKMKTISLYL